MIRPFIDEWLAEMTSAELTDEEGAYIMERVKAFIRTPPDAMKQYNDFEGVTKHESAKLS